MKAYFLILSMILLASCSSSTSIKVTTEPAGAKILVRSMGTKSYEEMGVTPLTISSDDLEKKKIKDGPLYIDLQKEGYKKSSVLLAETEAVDIEVQMNLNPEDKLENARKYDELSNQLFEVQRLIRTKSFEEALKITATIKKDFPELSVPNELEGSIYYLQSKFKKSLEAFNLAYSKNTENAFVLKMKKLIIEKTKSGK